MPFYFICSYCFLNPHSTHCRAPRPPHLSNYLSYYTIASLYTAIGKCSLTDGGDLGPAIWIWGHGEEASDISHKNPWNSGEKKAVNAGILITFFLLHCSCENNIVQIALGIRGWSYKDGEIEFSGYMWKECAIIKFCNAQWNSLVDVLIGCIAPEVLFQSLLEMFSLHLIRRGKKMIQEIQFEITERNVSKLEDKLKVGVRYNIVKKLSLYSISEGMMRRR